ncbi:Uncharacterised protein [Klebsiella pneumoniae]|nr:hypothetical protein BvCmsOUNP021_00189 [Escherichia coli]SWA73116.1 Uncharacterised protein [Klebsiella pneumoniae]
MIVDIIVLTTLSITFEILSILTKSISGKTFKAFM